MKEVQGAPQGRYGCNDVTFLLTNDFVEQITGLSLNLFISNIMGALVNQA